MDFVQLMVATAAVVSVVIAGLAFFATRKKDAAQLNMDKEVETFNELKMMNDVLRAGLHDAQEQADQLNSDLEIANTKLETCRQTMVSLNSSMNVALANVTLLRDFIEEHVPLEVPRPKLRRVP